MDHAKDREIKRVGRHRRLRKKIAGTSDQPRLCVHRSLNNFYAQIIDDSIGKVLFGMSTREKNISKKIKYGGNVNAASTLGDAFAVEVGKKGIKKICFDRGGYRYHGRVKAFAEAVRKGGMEF